jgi:predicted aspartyl protease
MFKFLFLTLILLSTNVNAAVSQWLEFTNRDGHIVIPIKVAGIQTKAILDTGAQIHAINQAFLDKYQPKLIKGQKIRVEGVNSIELRQTYDDVPVGMFGADIKYDDVALLNFGDAETALIIGAGFFSSFIVQIDYPNQKMRIMTRDAIDLQSHQNIKFEAQKGSGRPLVRVKVGKQSIWGLMDTGSTSGMLVTRTVAARIGMLDMDTEKLMVAGVNSSSTTEKTYAAGVEFGPYTLDDVQVIFPEDGETLNLESQHRVTGTRMRGRKVEAIIGFDVFKHFLLTFDYKGGHMHVSLPEES